MQKRSLRKINCSNAKIQIFSFQHEWGQASQNIKYEHALLTLFRLNFDVIVELIRVIQTHPLRATVTREEFKTHEV